MNIFNWFKKPQPQAPRSQQQPKRAKIARKVSLLNIADYPRDQYSVYWTIVVTGDESEGFMWRARLEAYDVIAWEWRGATTTDRPDVPWPVYPAELPYKDADYKRADEAGRAKIRTEVEARRQECSRIYEAHPKPLYFVDEVIGQFVTEDEARAVLPAGFEQLSENIMRDACDYAAQSWVLEQMPKYRKPVNPQAGFALTIGPLGMLLGAAAELARRILAPLLMAVSYSTTIRTNRITQVLNAIDGGAGAGLWRIYDGTRPATCGTATTLLAEITLQDPSGSVASQVLTFDNTPGMTDASANATGTATWGRIVDSTGTCCVDHNVGTSGSDLNLNSTSISVGQEVTVSSATITAGNA